MRIKTNDQERIYIFDAYIVKNLLRSFEDQIERHRETAITIVQYYLNLGGSNLETLRLIVETIINRLNQLPFPETSEEIRLSLIRLLQKINHEAFCDSL